MKVLVATNETQGEGYDDFCFVPPGEIVEFAFVCGKDRDEADEPMPNGPCGCGRAFAAIPSGDCTTTAIVVERPDLDTETLRVFFSEWKKRYPGDTSIRDYRDCLGDVLIAGEEYGGEGGDSVAELSNAIKDLPLGTIVERRGNFFQVRRQ